MQEKQSICYMSLADAFLSRITQDVKNNLSNQRRIDNGLGVEVVPVYTDRQVFIENYLQHLYVTKQGIFCKQRSLGNKKPDLFVYDCERSCLSKGTSTGDPTKTRANGCRAYVSFAFEEGAVSTVCILRYRLIHVGHNPANREECKVNRIDPALKTCIQEWIQESPKVPDILMRIGKWNKLKGHTDYKDRRFFPSQQDIHQLVWLTLKNKPESGSSPGKLSKKFEIGIPAVDPLSTILKLKYREMCIYYHPSCFNGTNSKPMILILQTQHQKDVFKMHGDELVFITKNFEGLRVYGSAVYSLVVKDESEVAYPIAYILSNMDDTVVLIQALHKFQGFNKIHPKAFFIDKDLLSCCEGISLVYPKSLIYIPQYQVLKGIQEWLSHSAVSGIMHKDVREVLLKYVLDLSRCKTENEYVLGIKELQQKVDYPEFNTMLKTEYLSCGARWCEFGRMRYFTQSQSSIMAERLFLNLEHQLLKGLQSIYKVEELIEYIAKDLNHGSDGEAVINMEDFLEGTPEEQAENHLQEGWGNHVCWLSNFELLIPSDVHLETYYTTRIISLECDCPTPSYKGLCMHLHLALMLVNRRMKDEGGESIEAARNRIATEAKDNCDYLFDNFSCTTFHTGIICVTSLADYTCTCKASFFGSECVGAMLLRKVQNQEPSSIKIEENPQDSSTIVCEDPPKEVIEYTVTSEGPDVSSDSHLITEPDVSPDQVTVSAMAENSSKTLIDNLYLWSISSNFVDSEHLRLKLLEASEIMNQNQTVESSTEKIKTPPQTRQRKFSTTSSGSRSPRKNRPYTLENRLHAGQPTRESPRKSSRIKTLLHYR